MATTTMRRCAGTVPRNFLQTAATERYVPQPSPAVQMDGRAWPFWCARMPFIGVAIAAAVGLPAIAGRLINVGLDDNYRLGCFTSESNLAEAY